MNNREAIEILTEMPISTMSGRTFEEIADALDLAIKGLEFISENYPETFKDYLNGEQDMRGNEE